MKYFADFIHLPQRAKALSLKALGVLYPNTLDLSVTDGIGTAANTATAASWFSLCRSTGSNQSMFRVTRSSIVIDGMMCVTGTESNPRCDHGNDRQGDDPGYEV